MTLSVVPKIQVVETRENFARFAIEPLEKGFGITLGNALRRIMLGHLPGAARSVPDWPPRNLRLISVSLTGFSIHVAASRLCVKRKKPGFFNPGFRGGNLFSLRW